MIDKQLDKARILIEQEKYSLAKKVLQESMQINPNDVNVLATYAQALMGLEEYPQALELVETALGIEPTFAYLYYLKSKIQTDTNKRKEALTYIQKAIEVDPYEAHYRAYFAFLLLHAKDFNKALTVADEALHINAENILALNVRSKALLKLDKKEESAKTIDKALDRDPNNPFTHANYGWTLLEKGEHKQSLTHFREALRLDPTMEFAKSGMSQALKGKYWFYRLYLKYLFWITSLSSNAQFAFIIGIWLLANILNRLADTFPIISPIVTPLIVVYSVFAFSTWIIQPVGNVFLRFNQYGRHLLDEEETLSSTFVGASVLIGILSLVAYLFVGKAFLLTLGAIGILMMLPFSVMFKPARYKYALKSLTLLILSWGLYCINLSYNYDIFFTQAFVYFLYALFAFQWVSAFLIVFKKR